MRARLPVLEVAAPCPVRWEDLAGDDHTRYCGQCQQHVYNVESFTPDEVVAFIRQREGRICVRLRRRSDGTVITRDCWYAVRRARERLVGTVIGLAVAATGFWGGVGALARLFSRRRAPVAASPVPVAARPEPVPDKGRGCTLEALPPPVAQPARRPTKPRPRPKKPPEPRLDRLLRREPLDELGLMGIDKPFK